MPLNTAEQILYDFIKANRESREYWEAVIKDLPGLDFYDDTASIALEDKLYEYYVEKPTNWADIAFLLGKDGLVPADMMNVADALLETGLVNELPHVIDEQRQINMSQEDYFLWKTGIQSGPFTLPQIKSMWKEGTITSDMKYWSDVRQDWSPVKEIAEGESAMATPTLSVTLAPMIPKKETRTKGTKANPISIISASYLGVAMHARGEIDNLFGEGKWTKKVDFGDIHGLRCWVAILEDGSSEEVWFDYSPAAALVARREAGEKVGLDSLPAAERKKIQNAYAKALREVTEDRELRRRLKEGDPTPKDDDSNFTMFAGCGCFILGLAGLAILVFAGSIATRVWTVVGGIVLLFIFSSLSQYFDGRLKMKRAKEPSAQERINQKFEAAFATYKQRNPGMFFMQTLNETESRAAFQKFWEKENDFTVIYPPKG